MFRSRVHSAISGVLGSFLVLLMCGVVGAAPASAAAQLPVPYGAAAVSDFLANETLDPTALVGGNVPCRPTAQHPDPVILVHGTFEDEGSNWVTFAPLLKNAGYCVFALNYGPTSASFGDRVDGLGNIPASAAQLHAFINRVLAETGARKVDIVGHSQGGLLPGYDAKFLGDAAKINDLVELGTTNHGTTLDGIAAGERLLPVALQQTITTLINSGGGPALTEQEVGSSFERALFASGDTVAGPRYTVIDTTHDEVTTPYTNAFLHAVNATDITLQNQCPNDPTGHVGLDFDGPTVQDVLNALSNSPRPNFQPACIRYGPAF
jgi:hypothetical protein